MENERQQQPQSTPMTPVPPEHTDLAIDMGTLGYGQGMDYQYAEAPQPTAVSIAQQQIQDIQSHRFERVRRQQKKTTDITTRIARRDIKNQLSSLQSLSQPPYTPGDAGSPEIAVLSPVADEQPDETRQNTGSLRRSQLKRATIILSSAFIVSRVLGLLRSSMLAAALGAGAYSSAFVNAFVIPDTIFNIVAGGALTSAFIPIFTKYMAVNRDEDRAWHIANTALTLATCIMLVLALLAMIFAGQLVPLYNIGHPETTPIIVELVRIMLLQAIILGAGTITSAILNAQQNFMLPAIGTVLYNIGIIAGLLPGYILQATGHRNDAFTVKAAAIGVVVGALFQVAIQIPGLRRVGMRIRLSFHWNHPDVLQIGRLMLPRVFNAVMLSSSTFVDAALISLLSLAASGADVDGLRYESYQAMSLMQLPLGLFGMAMSTAAFPMLADYFNRGRLDSVRAQVLETLRGVIFLSLPSALGLIILGLPLIEVLLFHGQFAVDVHGNLSFTKAYQMTIPLALFAFGLPGFAAVEILTRSFYAMRDSRTPVIISILQFALKIALSILLISPFTTLWGVVWGMGSLALATTIASILEALVLFLLLHNRLGGMLNREQGRFALRVTLATLGMGLATLLVRWLLDTVLVTTDPRSMFADGSLAFFVRTIKLAVEILVGTFIYLHLARFLQIEELGPIRRLLERFKLSWLA